MTILNSYNIIPINRKHCTDSSHPTMKDLNEYVTPLVATKWYDLGLQLLETKYERELDIIEENYKNYVKKCCRQMFSKWLETRSAGWSQLTQAVKNIDLNSAANYIEQFIGGGYHHVSRSLFRYSLWWLKKIKEKSPLILALFCFL